MLGGVHRETAKTLGAVESKADSVLSATAKEMLAERHAPSKHEVVRISICQRTATLLSQVH